MGMPHPAGAAIAHPGSPAGDLRTAARLFDTAADPALRAHDLPLALERQAGPARLPDPAHACRPQGQAARLGNLAAWDFIGSKSGNRGQQYEKFYGGASFLVKQNMYRAYDFARATAMVDDALALPLP